METDSVAFRTPLGQQECERALHDALQNPVRRGIMYFLSQNCQIKFQCCNCDEKENLRGYYQPSNGNITICSNFVSSAREVNEVTHHELVHAYDYCVKNVTDFRDCDQLACSEIRAASVAECSNRISFWKTTCIKKVAIDSTRLNCKNPTEAVERMFDQCYTKADPFQTFCKNNDTPNE